MLKFQECATAEDLKTAASIERKRRFEEERKLRIFNPRVRKFGIDKEFLDRQVEEKKQQRESELATECRIEEALLRSSELAVHLEKQQEEERRKINKDIECFRRMHQRVEDRREYDLNDPDALRKSALPCENDFGAASVQRFEGEDRKLAERRRVQKDQMRWWIQTQTEQREVAEKAQREIEKAQEEALLHRDERAVTLARMEDECRRRLNEATAKFNLALAEEQQHRRHSEAVREEEDKKAEIYNHVTGDFLSEAREQAESVHGRCRPLASRYKGMSTNELKTVRNGQLEQIEQIRQMRLEEKRINDDWDRVMMSHMQAATSYQEEQNQKKLKINKKIAEENLRLAEQQKSYQEYLNQVVYRNHPSNPPKTNPHSFHDQFNKGTR